MALMIIAMLVVPTMDAIAKWLSASVSAGQVVWYRFAFQTLLLLPFFLAARGRFILGDMPVHAARGGLMVFGTVVFFTALKHMPIADAIAIFFVEPLILTLMAALVLGEKIGWRRLTAVIVGFVGALIVIRPNFEAFGWPALLPLAAATTFSVYLIITRTLSQREDPIPMQFYSGRFRWRVRNRAHRAWSNARMAVVHPHMADDRRVGPARWPGGDLHRVSLAGRARLPTSTRRSFGPVPIHRDIRRHPVGTLRLR